MSRVMQRYEVRIDGVGQHGLAEIGFEKSKEKTPVFQIGEDEAVGYTSGPKTGTFSGQAISKPDGTWGLDWDAWLDDDEERTVALAASGRTDRLTGAVLDSLGESYSREDGRRVRDISGKFTKHSYE